MIDERMEALVHEEIDGVASPEDRSRLRELLEQNPDLRAFYADMRGLSAAMERIRMEEPPPALKANILQFVAEHRIPPASPIPTPRPRSGWRERLEELTASLRRRPAWGGSLVFAGGVAAGLLLFAWLSPPAFLDTGALTGTMTPVGERFERIASRSVDFQGVHGVLETGLSPEGTALRLEFRSDRETEITVGFLGRPQTFRGFFQLHPRAGLVSFDPGGLRILHRGENRYLLTLAGNGELPDEVTVRIRVGGEVLEERLPVARD